MNRPELLAPVGDWQMLRAAVHNGTDAVYIGMPGFNARGRSATLSIPELRSMIEYAHLYGVRVLLACNVLVFERELSDVLTLLAEVIPLRPDALIVQDIGLIRLIKAIAPDQVVHASTQMTITNAPAIHITRELGIQRYVLGREVSLAEMSMIRRELVGPHHTELEVFVHGALCVSYSGQCLTSESLGGRSANRGQCAQSCRLPYELFADGAKVALDGRNFLVSPKDLCSLEEISDLCAVGIDSFKIEGRLKSPEYVASTVRAYRERIDALKQGNSTDAIRSSLTPIQDLQKIYSRGFFSGWMHGVDHQRLVDGRYGSHFGLEVGSVSRTTPSYIEVYSDDPMRPGDGVLFLNSQSGERCGASVFSAERISQGTSPSTWRLAFSRDFPLSHIKVGHAVFINSAPSMDRQLHASFEDRASLKRIPIAIKVTGSVGETLRVEVHDELGNVVVASSMAPLQAAQNAPLTDEAITSELGALGGTIYVLDRIEIGLTGDVFLHNRELKNLRREFCELLNTARRGRPKISIHLNEGYTLLSHPLAHTPNQTEAMPPTSLSVLIRDISQVEALDGLALDTVYLDFEFGKEYAEAATAIRSLGLKVGIATTRIMKPGELSHLKVIERIVPDAVLVRNLGALHYFKNSQLTLIGDFSLNAANSLTAGWLYHQGLTRITPSADLNGEQLLELLQTTPALPWEVILHHYMPAFHMEHCVFAAFLSKGSSHRDCGRPCEKHRVELRDPNGNVHPLKADAECRNTMFNGTPQTAIRMYETLRSRGVRSFRLEALFEDRDQLRSKVVKYTEILAGRITVDAGISQLLSEHLAATEQVGVTDGQLYNIRAYQDRKKTFTHLSELTSSADPALSLVQSH